MPDLVDEATIAADAPEGPAATAARLDETHGGLVEDELLVEEISIDGMCGVY
jgi:mycofactocin precursor